MKLKNVTKNVVASVTAPPYSRLFFVDDGLNWVLSWELRETRRIADNLGIATRSIQSKGAVLQSVFHASKYVLLKPLTYLYGFNRVAFPYFHGYPSSGEPIAVRCYRNLKKYHHKLSRIQVSHSHMRNVVLDSGIDSSKVFLIPIAINTDFFPRQTAESKGQTRDDYGMPQDAVVIGSFQKDGSGWGRGAEPKLIKGPDVFLKTVEILRQSTPELFVLLSGPARGYVKAGLEKLTIPYKHINLEHYPEIGKLYQCLDLYLVASREEGGPKAVLESMACGVPLVTTRVGQAMDLVRHEENAMMVDVEDAEGLAFFAQKLLADTRLRNEIIENGFAVVEQNTYTAHTPLWKEFFNGFVKY